MPLFIFRRYDRTGLVEYRSTHLAYHTLLIKDFPSGGVARITMEAGAPVHYLYFLVQANSDGTSLNECPTKRTLIIPSEQGAFVLDPSWRENEDWLERVKLPSRRVVAAGEVFGGPAGKTERLFSPGSLVAPPPHAPRIVVSSPRPPASVHGASALAPPSCSHDRYSHLSSSTST